MSQVKWNIFFAVFFRQKYFCHSHDVDFGKIITWSDIECRFDATPRVGRSHNKSDMENCSISREVWWLGERLQYEAFGQLWRSSCECPGFHFTRFLSTKKRKERFFARTLELKTFLVSAECFKIQKFLRTWCLDINLISTLNFFSLVCYWNNYN